MRGRRLSVVDPPAVNDLAGPEVAVADVAPAKRNGKHEPEAVPVKLLPIRIGIMTVRLVGDAPLIVHNFDRKAQQEILDKQMGKAKQKKEAKKPAELFEASKYKTADGKDGFPAANFKKAAVAAASFMDDMKKTLLRGAFYVEGDIVPLEAKKCVMRQDMVRIGGMNKTADVRFRAEYPEWAVSLRVRYNQQLLTPEVLINLFNIAGFSVGVGERRPQKEGLQFGTWHVDPEGSK